MGESVLYIMQAKLTHNTFQLCIKLVWNNKIYLSVGNESYLSMSWNYDRDVSYREEGYKVYETLKSILLVHVFLIWVVFELLPQFPKYQPPVGL